MAGSCSTPVVVITGGSAGVGRALATAFAARGWRVSLLARGRRRLQAAAAAVEQAGGEAAWFSVDVSDAQAVTAAAEATVARFGGIDVWINNAMATVYGRVVDVAPEEFARVTAVTYLGVVNGTRAALAHMRPRDRGLIVQVG
ncbi:MAG TPA: SDR family NAD(P)-dependent oxidoreductase, partial [Beijerinckiaceae bacterium]